MMRRTKRHDTLVFEYHLIELSVLALLTQFLDFKRYTSFDDGVVLNNVDTILLSPIKLVY